MIIFSVAALLIATEVSARKKNQESTRQYRDLYATLLNALSERVFMLDDKWRVVFANQTAEQARNISKDDYDGVHFLDLVPDLRGSVFHDCIQKVMDTRQPERVVGELRDDEDRMRWFDLRVNPVPGGVLCLSTDITELKRVHGALAEGERQYRSIFENAAIGICIVSLEGHLLEANNALCNLLDYTPSGLRGLTLAKLIFDEDVTQYERSMHAILNQTSSQFQHELRLLNKDGAPIWCNLTASMDVDSEGDMLYLIVMVEDVSQKHAALTAVQDREDQFKQQYKGIPVPTYTWQKQDDDFILIDYNVAAETFTGGHVANIMGVKASERYANDPETLRDFHECYDQQVTVTRSRFYKLQSFPNEKFLMVSFAFVPPNLVMVHTIDMTERENAQAALKHSETRFRSMVEHTIEAIYCYEYDPPIVLDAPAEAQLERLYEAVLVECNNVAARAHGGAQSEDVLGKRLSELNGSIITRLDLFFGKLLENDYQAVDVEIRELEAEGALRYLRLGGRGIVENGKLLRVWGNTQDITERRMANDALQASERQLKALFDHSRDAILIADTAGRILNANTAADTLFGTTPGELEGHTAAEFTSNDASVDFHSRFRTFLETGEETGMWEVHRRDGTVRIANYVAKANVLPGQHVSFLTDITEQQRLEAAEVEQRAFAESLLQMASDLLDNTLDSR